MKPRDAKGRYARLGRPRIFKRDAEAVALYRAGMPYKDVARQMGVPQETVRRALRAAGVEMRRRGKPRLAVDPVWGKLGHIMYRPRTPEEIRGFELKPGQVRVDLGGERNMDRPKAP
jgi:transposase-like protein